MSDQPSNESLRRAILQSLEGLQAAGVQQLPKPTEADLAAALAATAVTVADPADAVEAPLAVATPRAQPAKLTTTESPAPAADGRVSMAPSLEVLQREVAACSLCPELASTRTQTVFGVGNPRARLCILGEAPGADEDRLGEPFVGKGGQLLNKILEACQLRREDVYILNILRCRPPDNRNPSDQEAGNCRQFLTRQIQLIDPEFICCMGAVAAQNLLATTTTIGRLRGSVHNHGGIKVVCTYHPAYLLRNPSAKKNTWEDMKMLMREMGTPVE